mmetsp:Transcript_14784/g.46539  ORF Transcript_14784/g.46539 Transcript_14784/m.46539 type:complete len:267 (-) Transcript_14784:22-822(-)
MLVPVRRRLRVHVEPPVAAPATRLPWIPVRGHEAQQRLAVDAAVRLPGQRSLVHPVHQRETVPVGGNDDVHTLGRPHVEAVLPLRQLADQLVDVRNPGLDARGDHGLELLRAKWRGGCTLRRVRSARPRALPEPRCAGRPLPRRQGHAQTQLCDHAGIAARDVVSLRVPRQTFFRQRLDRPPHLPLADLQASRERADVEDRGLAGIEAAHGARSAESPARGAWPPGEAARGRSSCEQRTCRHGHHGQLARNPPEQVGDPEDCAEMA